MNRLTLEAQKKPNCCEKDCNVMSKKFFNHYRRGAAFWEPMINPMLLELYSEDMSLTMFCDGDI